jgi:uncharacterized protein (UPF0332 family)
MKAPARALLVKADRATRAAERLMQDDGDLDFAAGRASYAMYYAAQAGLHETGRTFSKHSRVHGAFGELFAKSGTLDPRFHRYLLDAFAKRLDADYGIQITLRGDEVRILIEQAVEFVAAIRGYLAREG